MNVGVSAGGLKSPPTGGSAKDYLYEGKDY